MDVRYAIRRTALERDWNRLRDDERDWRIFTRRVFKATLIVLVLVLLSGCTDELCRNARATVAAGELCGADPECHQNQDDYYDLTKARINVEGWCRE